MPGGKTVKGAAVFQVDTSGGGTRIGVFDTTGNYQEYIPGAAIEVMGVEISYKNSNYVLTAVSDVIFDGTEQAAGTQLANWLWYVDNSHHYWTMK